MARALRAAGLETTVIELLEEPLMAGGLIQVSWDERIAWSGHLAV